MSTNPVTIERFRPDFLWNKPHFTNLVTSQGGKTIHVSGLVAADADGNLIAPGDLGAQLKFVYDSIKQTLSEVGATPANVVRQRVFVVGLRPEQRPIISGAMIDFYGGPSSASSTCVGVEALLVDQAMVEIDVTAVIDAA